MIHSNSIINHITISNQYNCVSAQGRSRHADRSHRFHRLPGRRRHATLRFLAVPAIGAARDGLPPRIARLSDAIPVRQLPRASHQRAGRQRHADSAQPLALHHRTKRQRSQQRQLSRRWHRPAKRRRAARTVQPSCPFRQRCAGREYRHEHNGAPRQSHIAARVHPACAQQLPAGGQRRFGASAAVRQHTRAERGGNRSWTVAVPEQYRSVSGRQAHYVRAGRRTDHLDADRFDGVFRIGGRFDGASVGAVHHGDADLSAFVELPADCCAGRR